MNRFYQLAWRLAWESPRLPQHPTAAKRMACVVAKGGKVLSRAINQNYRHAEERALRPHNHYENATVVVARANGQISRPCAQCIPLIQAAGIREIVYMNEHLNLTREYLR